MRSLGFAQYMQCFLFVGPLIIKASDSQWMMPASLGLLPAAAAIRKLALDKLASTAVLQISTIHEPNEP